MSEPNVFGLREYSRKDIFEDTTDEIRKADKFYIMHEVDEVIKDITEGAMSMFRESNRCRGLDTKSPLGRIADVAFKHWNRVEYTMSNNRQLRLDKANLLRSNEDLRTRLNSEMGRRLTDELEYDLNIRHNKYKRCLLIAKWCKESLRLMRTYEVTNDYWNLEPGHDAEYFCKKGDFYCKWRKRWLKLAEKFKEAKGKC